ncbi:oxidoreductase family, NAD-binding rossmann fold domain-containing protein [Phthorimaea operculella]|nr:oxidoreductase family, NAD-binding rossmann fold domain-containing protein [Phthorimaea operculella]
MPLRWGIVTAAKICNDFVNAFNSYPEIGDQTIVGIAARDKTRATAFAKTHNIPKVYDSYQALAKAKDVDVVYIGALNSDHFALSKLFLENGKHVLCEKSLCLNYKQAKGLIDLAKKKKLFLMEAVWSRFFPIYAALEKQLELGKLGDVKFVEANFGVEAGVMERVLKKNMGGGALLDVGIYVLQFAQFVFKDEPIKVLATGGLNSDGVDVWESIILEYSGGRRAVLNTHSQLKMWNKATIVGTKGRITLEDPFHCPTQMILADGDKVEHPLHSSKLPYVYGNSAGLVFEALEVMKCINAGLIESPACPTKRAYCWPSCRMRFGGNWASTSTKMT